MIESISHITFVVKDVKRSAELLSTVFDAQEVYDSSDKNFSIAYEKFFLIGGTWIALMEGAPVSEKTYNHIAFEIPKADIDHYITRIRELGLEMIDSRTRIRGEGRSVYFYDYDNHLFELHAGTLEERLASYCK